MPAGISKKPTLATLIDLWEARKLYNFLERESVNPASLYAGFKTAPASLKKPLVRNRLQQELRRNPDLMAGFLCNGEAPWCDWLEIVESFEDLWLLEHWRWLLRGPQGLLISAAMATDFRPRIAARGTRVITYLGYPWRLKERTSLNDDNCPRAWTLLMKYIAGSNKSEPGAGDNLKATNGKLTTLERELAQARESGNRLKEKVKDLEGRLADIDRNDKEKIKQLHRELAHAKVKLNQQEQVRDEAIRSALANYRAKLFGADGIYEILEKQLAEKKSGDLLADTEQILEAQAKLDRKFGTIRQLREENDLLLAALAKLDEAMANSIRQLPELAETRKRIRGRLAEITDVLPSRSHTPEILPAKLSTAIETTVPDATGFSELEAIGQFLDSPTGSRLLDEGDKKRLKTNLAQKHSWIETIVKEKLLAEAVSSVLPDTSPEPSPQARVIWDIPFELARLDELPILVIDGYNLIKRVPALARIEEQISQAKAREQVNEACQSAATRFTLIRIVYDSSDTVGTREMQHGIEVVFARQRGEDQHADDEIVEWLENRETADSAPVWLATDDHGLRRRTSSYCSGFLAVTDLASFLTLQNI